MGNIKGQSTRRAAVDPQIVTNQIEETTEKKIVMIVQKHYL